MTRLVQQDVVGITCQLNRYDQELEQKTGMTLRQIACSAAGISEDEFMNAAVRNTVAVIPVTTGEGVIPCFVQVVQGIACHLGVQAFETTESDVAGMAEGVSRGAHILLMADDSRFIALNTHTGTVADNNVATARGFVAALSGMAGGLKDREVLVLGAGVVGREILKYLKLLEARAAVFDVDPTKTRDFEGDPAVTVELKRGSALARYRYLIDATPQGNFLLASDLHPGVMMALPGVPLGLTLESCEILKGRYVHDPLQIGVAVMLALAVKKKS